MGSKEMKKESRALWGALREATVAAWPPRSLPARDAWRAWRAARKAWRAHALEPGVFFPGWAILMAALMIAASGTLLAGVFRHWGEWGDPAKAARLWTMLGASLAVGVAGPVEMLKRGRRISDLRREFVHGRDPKWAPIERQLRGRERAAREAYELAKECEKASRLRLKNQALAPRETPIGKKESLDAGGRALNRVGVRRAPNEKSRKKETKTPRRAARRI